MMGKIETIPRSKGEPFATRRCGRIDDPTPFGPSVSSEMESAVTAAAKGRIAPDVVVVLSVQRERACAVTDVASVR
jgi:hypothetical protein